MRIVAKGYISPYAEKEKYEEEFKKFQEQQKKNTLVNSVDLTQPTKKDKLLVKTGINSVNEKTIQPITVIKPTYSGDGVHVNLSDWINTSAFDDGYQFGDITKTALSTPVDIGVKVLHGGLSTIEGIADTGTYLLADLVDFFGADNLAQEMRKNADFDSYAAWFGTSEDSNNNLFGEWQKGIDEYSLIGNKLDNVNRSIGQMGSYVLTGGVLGNTALSNAMVTFTSSYGNSKSQAKRNGASESDAIKHGMINGIAETISEQFFNGFGMKTADWGDKVASKIVNKFFNGKKGKIAMRILDSLGEGTEELLSNFFNTTETYLLDIIEKKLGNEKGYEYGMQNLSGDYGKDVFNSFLSEESLEQFFSAALSTAIVNGVKDVRLNTKLNNAINNYAKENNISVEQAKTDFEKVLGAALEENTTKDMNLKDKYELEDSLKSQLTKSVKQGLPLAEVAKSVDNNKGNLPLAEQLERQGTKILEEAESKRQSMIENFKEYLEEHNITNPTQQDIDDSLIDILEYDNDEYADNAKNEKLYNQYVREYMKENNIPFKEEQTSSFSLDKNAKRYEDLAKTRKIEYFTKDNGDVRVNMLDSNNNLVNQIDLYNKRTAISELGEELGNKIFETSSVDNQTIDIGNDINNMGTETDYFMTHRPTETQITADDLTKQGDEVGMPKDMYEHLEDYSNNKETAKETIEQLKKVRNNPNAEVTIYRATTGNKINKGDWVTLSRKYAEEHNNSNLDGKGNIIEQKVKASDIQYAGDVLEEWGYFPKEQTNLPPQKKVNLPISNKVEYNNSVEKFTNAKDTIDRDTITVIANNLEKFVTHDAKIYEDLNMQKKAGQNKNPSIVNIDEVFNNVNKDNVTKFRLSAIKKALSLFRDKFVDLRDINTLVQIGKNGIRETYSKALSPEKINSSNNIKDIIGEGIYGYSTKTDDSNLYHHFYVPVNYQNKNELFRVVIRENVNEKTNKFHFHQLEFVPELGQIKNGITPHRQINDRNGRVMPFLEDNNTNNEKSQINIPTAEAKQEVNLPTTKKIDENKNIEYNELRGDNSVNRTSTTTSTNNVLQYESNNKDTRYSSSNNEQRNVKTNKYVYSPKSFSNESRTVREIFGENAKTNENNKGTKLTINQNNFYQESKIRNNNGNLMEVYHGTKENFEKFDKSKIGTNTHNKGLFGTGFYFTDNKALATSYNWDQNVSDNYEPMALYLNIKNPFYWNSIKTEEQMKQFAKDIGLDDDVLSWSRYSGEMHVFTKNEQVEKFTNALKKNGYDGVVYKYDHGQTTSELVAFEPNQIKSIDNLNPTNLDDIYDSKELETSSFNLPTYKNTKSTMPLAKKDDVLKLESKRIADAINKKGGYDFKQRSWIETSTESKPVKGKVLIEDLSTDKINYLVQSNKKSLDTANRYLDSHGYEESLNYVNELMKKDSLPKASDVALMQRMVQEAVKKGDYETAQNLIMDTAILGTDLGQATQALSIIQKLTPEGQLAMYTKIVQRAKARGETAYDNVKITPEMVQDILEAYNENGTYDQNDLNKRVEKFKQDIADQMKTTIGEKVDAWRYLSMLGNPKTHIRNIVSNVAMRGTIKVKNAMARTLESVLPIENRTKTWKKASQDIKKFAEQTAINMKDEITGQNKYNEKTAIESKKQIFKNKTLEKLSNFNGNALEAEDWFFSKRAFQDTLAEYLTANNINTQEDIKNNPEIVEKGKLYAVEQAEIATFRQYSKLATAINQFERKGKIGKVAVEALMPFKRTPINIAKTGVAYSPLGLIKSISYDAYQLKQGNITASQFIDNLSQGLTGSSLTLLGYALAKAGFLTGSGGDDKDEKYDKQLGNTGYSIKIGDKSYTISWLSPVAMPLLVGANAYEQLEEEKEWDMNVVSETLAKTLDPLNEMSFLQGLTNALQSYGSGTDKIKGSLESAGQSYISQFFPTLFGQLASTLDDKKRSTKPSNNSSYKFGEQTIRNIMYKIPGLRQQLEPTTDIWGNEKQQSDNIIERAFESFLAPYTKNKDISTNLDKEINKVYDETGEKGVIPNIPYAYIKYDNETYKMTANEYTEYKKTYGKIASQTLNSLINSNDYKTASYEDKAKMIDNVYDYAKAVANEEYFNDKFYVNYENQTLDKINTLEEKYGITPSEYYANKKEYDYAYSNPNKYDAIKQITSYDKFLQYKDEIDNIKGEYSDTASRKAAVQRYINSLKLNKYQKVMLQKLAGGYSIKEYESEMFQYINSLNMTKAEKETLHKQLFG